MWDERQRTQKIGIELERVKRALLEQDAALRELMVAHGIDDVKLEATRFAWREGSRAGAPTRPSRPTGHFIRG